MIMKKSVLFASLITSVSVSQAADITFGIEGGAAFADLGAQDAASALATATGRTVSYSEENAMPYVRGFALIPLDKKTSFEVGAFITDSLDATFAFSGTTVTAAIGVDAKGIDFGARHQMDNFYIKGGAHYSELTGTVSVTISGTTYSASANETGMGYYVGAGYDVDDNTSLGFTHIQNIAGESDADANMVYVSYKF